MSGSKCTVKDKFFAKSSTDHFVVFKKEGSTYSPTPVAGPCIYMPAPEEYVAKFEMTSPSATKEAFGFTYFSSAPQTMTMVVPGVDGGSLKLLVSLAVRSYQLRGAAPPLFATYPRAPALSSLPCRCRHRSILRLLPRVARATSWASSLRRRDLTTLRARLAIQK